MNSKYTTTVISLLVSLLIYIFYRTPDTVINQLILLFLNENLYFSLRETAQNIISLPEVVIYSLPEGLWILSLTLSSMPFYIQIKNFKVPLIIFPPIIAIGFELIQYLHMTNGRYDTLDILYSLAFWGLSMIWYKKHNQQIDLFLSKSYATVICASNYLIVYFAHVVN
ncbi:MAG: hypothetical protein H6584_01460 [Flavobacteriales bacterium]|nr:hypothetical protein [Flavobacteriales bacterium]